MIQWGALSNAKILSIYKRENANSATCIDQGVSSSARRENKRRRQKANACEDCMNTSVKPATPILATSGMGSL